MPYFLPKEHLDPARNGLIIERNVDYLQQSIHLIEKCRIPVLAGVKGYCIGGGCDLISACDVAYSVKKSSFSIKEIDIGVVADLGILNRLPVTGSNWGLIKELSFTGRMFSPNEAKEIGLIAKVLDTEEKMNLHLFKLAAHIADKSPVAIIGIKKTLNYRRSRTIQEGLDFVNRINMSQFQTTDVTSSLTHFGKKLPGLPNYPKL